MGADKVISVDLNPYLKEELVKADLDYIQKNKIKIEKLFGDYIFNDRLNSLLNYIRSEYNLVNLLKFINVEYISSGDASQLPLSSQSINFHTSYTVFEHIPPEIPKAILIEGNRILKDNGLFVHKIDYSDHFSHSDKSISSINNNLGVIPRPLGRKI